jgi:Flp pilus assembly protein TadG
MRPRLLARADDGLAAVELALVFSVLLAMLALVAPLAYMFYERVQLGKASGAVIRFATSRSDKTRLTSAVIGGVTTSVTVQKDRLPTSAAVAVEAVAAYTGRGTVTMTSNTTATDTNCPSGIRRTIILSTTVSVGAFTGLLLGGPNQTLSATATSCEE